MRFEFEAEEFIEDRLKEPLLHGDAKHRKWLKEELQKWIPDLAELIYEIYEMGRQEVKDEVRRL